jgi:predicted acyltransferase
MAGQTEMRAPQRVSSVDVLRGLTIALMLLVNDPGDWEHVFRPLDHAEWNGWTLTDLVFPTFLFLMGASLMFSVQARRARGDCRKTLSGQVIVRALKIFALDLVLVYFPRMHWQSLRIYGVLTRIALCYLLAGLVVVWVSGMKWRPKTRAWTLAGVVVALLVGYWVLLRWVPVPGAGMPGRDVPFMDMDRNLASWLDRATMAWTQRWFHTGRLYLKMRDPEGLLSTLPAVASTLLGALAGMAMRAADGRRALRRMQAGLAAAAVLGVAAGELWSVWFPVNKNLWTSSYVLLAAGFAAMGLAALSWALDGRPQPWPRWLRVATWPWFVFGSNAIAAFTVSAVLVKGLLYFRVYDVDGDSDTLWSWLYEHTVARHGYTQWTSLAFAVLFVGACFLPNWWLWRRKWFLKI